MSSVSRDPQKPPSPKPSHDEVTESSVESFPASDPPSWTVTIGERLAAPEARASCGKNPLSPPAPRGVSLRRAGIGRRSSRQMFTTILAACKV
jgi:hypothetical protein